MASLCAYKLHVNALTPVSIINLYAGLFEHLHIYMAAEKKLSDINGPAAIFPSSPCKNKWSFHWTSFLSQWAFNKTVCNVFLFFFSFSIVGEFPWNEDINELEEKQCGKYFNPLLCSLNKNLTRQRCSCHNSTESDWWWAYALIFFDQDFKCPERSEDVTRDAKWLRCWMIKRPNQQPHFTSFLLNHLFPPPFFLAENASGHSVKTCTRK